MSERERQRVGEREKARERKSEQVSERQREQESDIQGIAAGREHGVFSICRRC